MVRRISLVLALTLLVGLAVGTAQGAAPRDGKKYRIAFLLKNLQSPFFIRMAEAAEQCDKDFDEISVDILAPQTPYSIDEQIQLVEQAITNRVDAIVITPCDSVGIVPAVKKANEAGILVVTPNTKSMGGNILAYVGVENYNVGYDLGVALCEALKSKGKVLLMEGKAGNSTAEERAVGFKDAIKKYPDIELLDTQPADFDRAKAMTVMENWLQTYDQIDGVLSINKDMGLGAVQAIHAAGRENEIISITFDLDDDVKDALREGLLYASGDQNEKSQAYIGIATALFALKGYAVDNNQLLPITIVTKDMLDD